MTMFLKTLLASAALGLGGTPAPQGSGHVQAQTADVAPHLPALAPQAADALHQKVSVTFKNATLGEVLKWLGERGLNFAAAPDAALSDRKLSLSVRDVPLSQVLEAIARAYGETWSKVGEVHVLAPISDSLPAILPLKELRAVQGEALRKALDPARIALPDPIELKLQLERSLDAARVGLDAAKARTAEEREAIEQAKKALEGVRAQGVLKPEQIKELSEMKVHLGEIQKAAPLGPEARDAMRKALEELRRSELLKPERIKELSELELRLGEVQKGKGMSSMPLGALQKLEGSLTPEQRALHGKRGYLRVSDLNETQRALLGPIQLEGEWDLTWVFGERRLHLRGG